MHEGSESKIEHVEDEGVDGGVGEHETEAEDFENVPEGVEEAGVEVEPEQEDVARQPAHHEGRNEAQHRHRQTSSLPRRGLRSRAVVGGVVEVDRAVRVLR